MGTILNVIMILAATGASVNGDLNDGQFNTVITAALSITVVMLGFFMAMFITGTRANIQELYSKVNENTTGRAVIDNTILLNYNEIKGELSGVRTEMGHLKEGLLANRELKEQIMSKLEAMATK